MKAEIITIGTEIMLGSITNTNVTFLSRRLMELGVTTLYHTSVEDDYKILEECLSLALERVDVVITTGGLGPTDDDISKEVLAKVTGNTMISDKNMENYLKNYFAYSKRDMTSNNLKQAMRPENSIFIENPRGTAPGIFMEWNGKKIIMMPGPPQEMNPMFEENVVDIIKDDTIIVVKSINTSGLGESTLETKIKELGINYPGFSITTYSGSGGVEIKVIGRGKKEDELEEKSNKILGLIKSKIGDYIFGYDNISIQEALLKKLLENNITIAVCESVTGGTIAKKITSVAGASKSFDCGLTTYSNRAKIDELGVSVVSLDKYGAVSSKVAYEMAYGLLNKTGVDIVISTTGYASPSKDTNVKTGQVFICIMTSKDYVIFERTFSGNREAIQERASNYALLSGLQFLNKMLTS